mmetsp:Transcript_44074/g.116567  ORF Transcript_44074/g.116567 Transcript_44074/m.116567 type:complete len:130 (-) Transcript_44074:1235-1624(-)
MSCARGHHRAPHMAQFGRCSCDWGHMASMVVPWSLLTRMRSSHTPQAKTEKHASLFRLKLGKNTRALPPLGPWVLAGLQSAPTGTFMHSSLLDTAPRLRVSQQWWAYPKKQPWIPLECTILKQHPMNSC